MNDISTYSSDYSTSDTYSNSTATMSPEATAAVIIFMVVFFLAFYALMAWLLGRIFKKAGVPSWIAWVPFYSNWKLLEIGGQQGFWAVLAIIPIVSYVSALFTYIAMYNIGLKLGKSGAYVLWAIFLPIVWFVALAFDKSTWNDDRSTTPVTPNTPPTPLA